MKENSEETLSSQIFQLLNSFYVWNLTLPLLRFFGFYTTPASNQLPAFNKEELDFIAKRPTGKKLHATIIASKDTIEEKLLALSLDEAIQLQQDVINIEIVMNKNSYPLLLAKLKQYKDYTTAVIKAKEHINIDLCIAEVEYIWERISISDNQSNNNVETRLKELEKKYEQSDLQEREIHNDLITLKHFSNYLRSSMADEIKSIQALLNQPEPATNQNIIKHLQEYLEILQSNVVTGDTILAAEMLLAKIDPNEDDNPMSLNELPQIISEAHAILHMKKTCDDIITTAKNTYLRFHRYGNHSRSTFVGNEYPSDLTVDDLMSNLSGKLQQLDSTDNEANRNHLEDFLNLKSYICDLAYFEQKIIKEAEDFKNAFLRSNDCNELKKTNQINRILSIIDNKMTVESKITTLDGLTKALTIGDSEYALMIIIGSELKILRMKQLIQATADKQEPLAKKFLEQQIFKKELLNHRVTQYLKTPKLSTSKIAVMNALSDYLNADKNSKEEKKKQLVNTMKQNPSWKWSFFSTRSIDFIKEAQKIIESEESSSPKRELDSRINRDY